MCGVGVCREREGAAPDYREQRTAQHPRYITHNVIVRRSTVQLPTTFVTSSRSLVSMFTVERALLRCGGEVLELVHQREHPLWLVLESSLGGKDDDSVKPNDENCVSRNNPLTKQT
jgi:hypothetical protein